MTACVPPTSCFHIYTSVRGTHATSVCGTHAHNIHMSDQSNDADNNLLLILLSHPRRAGSSRRQHRAIYVPLPSHVGRLWTRLDSAGVRPVSPSRSDTFLLLRHGQRPTGVAVELGQLWFIRCKRAIRGSFFGHSGSAAMHNQNSFVRGGR